jgi:DNA-directed RNA polymerase subunit RPC12/RpoP
MTTKAELGFSCGKFCATCGDTVSLDAFGRYTCFTCGRFVQASDMTQAGRLKTRKLKGGQMEFFAQESALMKAIKDGGG